MNKELKQSWITALKSGKYQQIKQLLTDGSGYCCLGVACIVAGLKIDPESNNDVLNENDKAAGYRPISIAFGLNSEEMNTLWEMNDVGGLSFDEIADYISENIN